MAKLSAMDFLSARYGTVRIGIETKTGKFDGIYISQDNSVVSEVLDHNGNDITAEMGLGLGNNVFKGDTFTTPNQHITSVTFTAGSGILVNAKDHQ